MKLIVDISDARTTTDQNDELVTYSLGSCIGVAIYDPATKTAGMLHYQLPSAKMDSTKADSNPFMFADTGFTTLLKKMLTLGTSKKRLRVKIAGGAQMLNDTKIFNIGKRNYAAIRQILWKNGMFIDAEDVGGKKSRNLTLRVSDGAVTIKSQGQVREL